MARGDRVELRGFGAFGVKHRLARLGPAPRQTRGSFSLLLIIIRIRHRHSGRLYLCNPDHPRHRLVNNVDNFTFDHRHQFRLSRNHALTPGYWLPRLFRDHFLCGPPGFLADRSFD